MILFSNLNLELCGHLFCALFYVRWQRCLAHNLNRGSGGSLNAARNALNEHIQTNVNKRTQASERKHGNASKRMQASEGEQASASTRM